MISSETGCVFLPSTCSAYIHTCYQVEQCFALSARPYIIQYTDDDEEVTDITNEADLTEAIQFFRSGSDDPPPSSAASILSGRSFRSKITLKVKITVDYGLNLSDTGSLASLDEYRDRNGSNFSLSLTSSRPEEVDDDSVTVSSKDMGSKYDKFRGQGPKTIISGVSRDPLIRPLPRPPPSSDWDQQTVSSAPRSSINGKLNGQTRQTIREDDHQLYPADPSSVFDRLKLQESMDGSSPGSSLISSQLHTERGAAWLRDQNARAVKAVLGDLPEPSESDQLSAGAPDDTGSIMSGELELQKDDRGNFYYAYTSGPSFSATHSSYDSGYDEASSIAFDSGSNPEAAESNPRNSLYQPVMHDRDRRPMSSSGSPSHVPPSNSNSTSTSSSSASSSASSSDRPPHPPHSNHRSHSEPILPQTDIPLELVPFITANIQPPTDPTDCSSCGALLESFRYVCSTCGEKDSPTHRHDHSLLGKGKGKDFSSETINNPFTYPPRAMFSGNSASSTSSLTQMGGSASSWTLVGDENPFHDSHRVKSKPLPSLPSSPPTSVSTPHLAIPGSYQGESLCGYELCAGCIEYVGVFHAVECSAAPGSSPGRGDWPPSPEEQQRAFSQWGRSAPKTKGQLRHAFWEKQWGPRGWQDVGTWPQLTAPLNIFPDFGAYCEQNKTIPVRRIAQLVEQ